jgi:hypothetical protein
MRKIGTIYLITEIVILISGLIDHYWIHKSNSIFFRHIGILTTVLSCIGIILFIISLIIRMNKKHDIKNIKIEMALIILSIVLPFIFLYTMLSQLH